MENPHLNILWLRRLPLFLLLFLAITLPQRSLAQSFNPLISFSVESCTLDKALEKLFADYELNVAFSKAELSKIRIESYSCSYKSVEEVLTDLLKGTDYGFKRIGKQYVIKKNQQLANDPGATVTPPAEPRTEVVKPKRDTVVSKTDNIVHIYDTLKIIRTVMRYDTVVQVKHETHTDTVYEVKYQGWQFPWPKFRNNGWFITPSVTLSSAHFKHEMEMPKPENFDEMRDLAEKIASYIGNSYERIDFYNVAGKVYFGEVTFYPGGGSDKLRPIEWEYILGSWIDLPKQHQV